jgi:soluble lytic murein transglycosylase-like protein
MQRKLPGYLLLSFFSFCFFTICFHTVANAEAPSAQEQLRSQLTPVPLTPTPTPYLAPAQKELPYFGQQLPTPLPKPTIKAPVDLELLFTQSADTYHVDKEVLKKIARCESGFNATSNNSGMYLGMFQFGEQTWMSTRAAMGLDTNPELRTNPEEAIKTAAFKISRGGIGAWPNCGK